MYTYFKKGSHSAKRKNDLVVNREKTTTFGKNSLRTLKHKIWNSLVLFKNVQDSLKQGTDLNSDSTSANTWVNRTTIIELCTLA